jgi:serine acetyltransferase
LPHGLNGIIVGHDAVIGANVTIYQQVTIAHGGVEIGNNVLLGTGCKILPGVKIGNNAKIGANCVVIGDVPENATCVLEKPRIIINK